ncbi:unnamed protein product [Rhizoctonia solani]|uniref:Protein kinase domain-containing protein n=1 Tax=Rhizoctonia solani TaxID=456999 RepID=A0A8H3H6C9_9AGAM|nr:unnamed protein product [Rhizoctonia solani]
MEIIKTIRGFFKPARIGRPANETDNYVRNREIRMREQVEQTKQDFHDMVGPKVREPLPIKASDRGPINSSTSSTPSHAPEPVQAGPSGATSPTPAGIPPEQPRSLATSRSVPVYSLADVKSTLRNLIGVIPTSSLQDEMSDLYGCCLVLISLLEKGDPSMESAPIYTFIFSKMQQDLNDITKVLGEWTNKKSTLQQIHRKDVQIQVRTFEEVFTRHLNTFIAISQSESNATMTREFAELQEKMGAIQNHGRAGGNSNPKNIEQADQDVLQERVRRKTGHTPDSTYILSGKISYREAFAMHQGTNFDVFGGELKDGEAIAIKLFRKPLKNDGEGVHFVNRIMRQVQLWTSFSSPFVLECRGIGMQMTASKEGEEYERFQFYLVSPFMKRGNAVHYIKELRTKGDYVNILKYLRDAARGIEHLHRKDCVHASIRGENVLIKDDGTACLNGFGLTKTLTAGKLIELTGDNLQFQFRWMAPELFLSNPPLNRSCDIWAWAMTALELITGQEPYYQMERWTSWTFNDRVVKEGKLPQRGDYPTFEQYCPQPDLMWALLEKCWASASERPTIDKVIDELENVEKAQIEQQTRPHNWA